MEVESDHGFIDCRTCQKRDDGEQIQPTHSATRTNRTSGVSEVGGNFDDLVENRLELVTGARRTDAPAQIPGPYHGDEGFGLRTREASVVLASSSERVYA
jgi:hypothetical protein